MTRAKNIPAVARGRDASADEHDIEMLLRECIDEGQDRLSETDVQRFARLIAGPKTNHSISRPK